MASDLVNTPGGYLPLFAGAEVVRRTGNQVGDLTYFAPRDLLQNLPPTYFTSRPYPYPYTEGVNTSSTLSSGNLLLEPNTVEGVDPTNTLLGGDLRNAQQAYTNWPFEGVNAVSNTLTGGALSSSAQTYTNWPFEGVDASSNLLTGGTLANALVVYSNYPAEGVNAAANTITGGTLA